MALKIFGITIMGDGEHNNLVSLSSTRPQKGWTSSTKKDFEFRFDNVYMGQLYDYAYYSDTFRTIVNVRQNELFRNGAEWVPNFTRKCKVCGIEYQTDLKNCTECGGTTRKPDKQQRMIADKFIKTANMNGQSLIDVLQSADPDSTIVDNCYVIVCKNYSFDTFGKIDGAEVTEIIKGPPLSMRLVMDRYERLGYDFETGKPVKVCPLHREKVQTGPRCNDCGKVLYPAHHYNEVEGNKTYYIPGEVIHKTMFTKTNGYGFPMMITALQKIKSLMAMDGYTLEYYAGKKTPKGTMLIKTSNWESMDKAWNKFLDRNEKNPHAIHPLFVPSTGNDQSSKFAEYIDFTRSLQEMQYMEARTEIINRIGALFGVSPIFQADLSAAGGLNNEGLQITITSRASESGQHTYNSMLKFIIKQFGVSDWSYQLIPPEEKDLMAEQTVEAQKLANAEIAQGLGFEVQRDQDGGYVYSEKKDKDVPEKEPETEDSNLPTEQDLTRPDGDPT